MKVVLVVGHSEVLQGATNNHFFIKKQIASEFNFNNMLAKRVVEINKDKEIDFIIEYRDSDYEALPGEINIHNADLVVSMHCNAFNTRVKGCETLYYQHTKISDRVAAIMQEHLCAAMGNANRGIKGRDHNRKKRIFERGAYLMKYVKAPCVICEPFFIDNDEELDFALNNIDTLSLAYFNGIKDSLELLKGGK